MNLTRLVVFLLACVSALSLTPTTHADEAPTKLHVYFGTYTKGESKGIYLSELDLKTGKITEPKLVAETVSPSFLTIHPDGKLLYAANETAQFKGEKGTGGVSAFSIDPRTGGLKFLNSQISRGAAPCHLIVDKTGKNVLVANYTGGNIASLPIQKGGKLGKASGFVQHKGSSVNQGRQSKPHAHSINLDANNKFAVAADLGLDQLLVYRFDAKKGTFTPNDPAFAKVAPGSGPRHFAFHPNGKNAYTINEMLRTVTAFDYDAKKGKLTSIQTITTVPKEVKSGSTAEVQVHPSGKFLYGSNRGHDSIAVYTIGDDGKLTHVEYQKTKGRTPRNFGIDPTGQFLLAANQSTSNVVVFRIDQKTGALTPTGQEIKVPTPVCVKFLAIP